MKPETITAAAIHSWRADAYLDKGDWDSAINDATESIRLNPRYFGGYLGTRHHLPPKRESGSGDQLTIDAAIGLDPNFARTYYNRAIAYGLKGDYNAAIRDNTEAIRRRGPYYAGGACFYNRAVYYHAIGKPDKAIADYNEAIRLAPNDLKNYCGRACLFEDTGELDKASADYDRATRYNATDTKGLCGFAERPTSAKGNYRAAASDFEKAARLSPRRL